MGAHLLVGMVAPLVLAAPVMLALRVIKREAGAGAEPGGARPGRQALTNPVVAPLLNVGGLCALYRSPLYGLMQQGMLVHVLVRVHFLLAGYLYTVALVPVDPSPHRTGFVLRSIVLVVSLAAHGVLAKLLYAYPPPGVTPTDAHTGAQLMFYGGDLVDFVLILLLCAQ